MASDYANFSDSEFLPVGELAENIPNLVNNSFFYTNQTYLAYMDTEGLDYQTEFGDNYDLVTVLPHTLIAENVFLVVRDRVNPAEVMELVEKLAKGAEKTEGTLSHRNGKLFGRFIVVINKCQDLTLSDEEQLDNLKKSNPSLITQISKYFTCNLRQML